MKVAGTGKVEYVEWPPDKKAIDIGDFYADSTKFKLTTGWQPSVSLKDGLKQTINFYRDHLDHYIDQRAETNRAAERV